MNNRNPRPRYGVFTYFSFLLLCALALTAITGCVTRTTAPSLENKAYAITRLVAVKVLAANPEWRPKFVIARDDLKILAAAPTVGLPELLTIVDRLPVAQLKDGDTALYVETGLLFFTDELGAVAVENPAQVRAAAVGMARALDQVLGN